ncbi:MAG: acetyl-CoA hydrolase/transferase family protein [Dehalococcoidia bacterium]
MDWREHYKRRLVTTDEAAKVVSSGDRIYVAIYPHPLEIIHALARRRDELRGVKLWMDAPAYDPGWLQPGWQDSFSVVVDQIIGGLARPALDARIIDYSPMIFSNQLKGYQSPGPDGELIDVLMLVVSPPDQHGFCSFGGHLWNKHSLMKVARKVLVQVDEIQIRTYGANYAHVSKFDYFVEHTPSILTDEEVNQLIQSVADVDSKAELEKLCSFMEPQERSMFLPQLADLSAQQIRQFGMNFGWVEPSEEIKRISQYVAELVKDGDTLQIGMGTPSTMLPQSGIFDGKRDLGWHSEMTAPGVVNLIKEGVITGARKTLHKDKAISSALTGARPSELRYAHNNPLIEQHDAEYVANVLTVAANENMVTLNNAISMDLSGQINAESVIGPRQVSGTGGQLDFQMGAILSKGGRAVTLLRSTALDGAVSRIVPQLEEGLTVSVPRTFADTVVTEYGVAQLLGRSLRERARELIAVAHPDFRSNLKKTADKLLYP